MADEKVLVPVWKLATSDVETPHLASVESMSPERLAEWRTVLAAFADAPVATLQVHTIERRRDASTGIALHASSPLATQLSQLVSRTATSAPQKLEIDRSGEVLYRMVVPSKFASQLGSGLVKSLPSKAVEGGIYGGLRNSTGIVGNATFVPVSGAGANAAKAGALRQGLARAPAR